jgi:hypothetical protein
VSADGTSSGFGRKTSGWGVTILASAQAIVVNPIAAAANANPSCFRIRPSQIAGQDKQGARPKDMISITKRRFSAAGRHGASVMGLNRRGLRKYVGSASPPHLATVSSHPFDPLLLGTSHAPSVHCVGCMVNAGRSGIRIRPRCGQRIELLSSAKALHRACKNEGLERRQIAKRDRW